MSIRRTGFLAVLATAAVLALTTSRGECITVRPAAFDHVEASLPEEVMAGAEFEVVITFVDRFGNVMPEGWKPDSSLSLTVSQPASVLPPVLTPENYLPGFRFRVSTEKMGDLTISLRDGSGKVLQEWQLTISSGIPVKLVAEMPPAAEVGQTVTLSFRALDMHGNLAAGYLPEEGMLTIENPSARVAGALKRTGRGTFEIPLQFQSPGQHSVNVRDRRKGLAGSSGTIRIAPAPLASFDVATGKRESRAGKGVALTIRALDRYGNPVTDYATRYKGVRLHSRDADIVPDLVAPASFSEGTARLTITMKSAGDHKVQVSEIQSSITGEFLVRVLPAGARRVGVRTPDSAVAGEPFEITLTVEDEYGNRVDEMPPGSMVILESTGTEKLVPDRVQGDAFTAGRATVKVSYERAESFDISARLSGVPGKAPAPGTEATGSDSRRAAEKAREEAVRARREARLRERRTTSRIGLPPPSPSPGTSQKSAPPKEKPEPKASPAPVVKKTAPPVVASRKPLRPGFLDSLDVKESGDGAYVTFSTNGMTDYNVTTSAKLSRKWIDIEFPDMRADLPDRIGGGEEIVGEVYVESSDQGRGVKVSVEILPVRIGYDVYQEGDSLILKVTRQ